MESNKKTKKKQKSKQPNKVNKPTKHVPSLTEIQELCNDAIKELHNEGGTKFVHFDTGGTQRSMIRWYIDGKLFDDGHFIISKQEYREAATQFGPPQHLTHDLFIYNENKIQCYIKKHNFVYQEQNRGWSEGKQYQFKSNLNIKQVKIIFDLLCNLVEFNLFDPTSISQIKLIDDDWYIEEKYNESLKIKYEQLKLENEQLNLELKLLRYNSQNDLPLVIGKKARSPIMGKKARTPIMGKIIKSPIMGKIVSSPIMGHVVSISKRLKNSKGGHFTRRKK